MRISNIIRSKPLWMVMVAGMACGPLPLYGEADYNPTNPAEPYTRHKVVTKADPTGYVSGGGMYVADTQVTIRTSSSGTNYTFSHWTKNDVYYSDQQQFTYTVEPQRTVFVAHYDYTPISPAEPSASNEYRLYLTNNIAGACSFNRTSGAKVEADNYVTVTAYYTSSIYVFEGWYQGSEKVSDAVSFNYCMPASNVTLTAKFSYNPLNPDDPDSSSSEDEIQNKPMGDANGDGRVSILDITTLVQYLKTGNSSSLSLIGADANEDGVVDKDDIDAISLTILNL